MASTASALLCAIGTAADPRSCSATLLPGAMAIMACAARAFRKARCRPLNAYILSAGWGYWQTCHPRPMTSHTPITHADSHSVACVRRPVAGTTFNARWTRDWKLGPMDDFGTNFG